MLFKINKSTFDFEFKSMHGMVADYLTQKGKLLQRLAKTQVGVDSGKLRKSINYKLSTKGSNLVVTVGSGNKVALWHHQGTKPHTILPKSAKTLRFNSRGKIVYAKVVHHPGTRPNKYLTDNLRKII